MRRPSLSFLSLLLVCGSPLFSAPGLAEAPPSPSTVSDGEQAPPDSQQSLDTAKSKQSSRAESASEPAAEQAMAAPVATTSSSEKLVAIMDLRSGKDSQAIARALSVIVAAEVAGSPGFRAVSRNDLRGLLEHQNDAQMLGCEDVKCMADIAKLAAADLLIAGSVERLEDAYVFSLQLIDPTQAKVLERQAATWRDDPDRMVELARPLVARLLAGPAGQSMSGELEIIAPVGSSLILDGESLGIAPLDHPIKHLSTGPHSVQAKADGFVPFNQQVVIINNERSLLRVEMVDADSLRPWYSRWWVWGSIGGGLALVGGATAAVIAYQVTQNVPATTLELTGELPIAAQSGE